MSELRVLHVLSQRPSLTGSGVTLEAIVRHGVKAGWDQQIVAGTSRADPRPQVAGLDRSQIHPLLFGAGPIDFELPGMSDVMPYPSSVWSHLSPAQLHQYRGTWKGLLSEVIETYEPHIIHAHHVWLLSSMIKDLAPQVPLVIHCHATGLRQMALCPHLAGEVTTGSRRAERFLCLHSGAATDLAAALSIPAEQITVVGAGYDQDLFHRRGRAAVAGRMLYVGKYSTAKGLPFLLDAFEGLGQRHEGLELHVVGGGGGPEARQLEERMGSMGQVTLHGLLSQPELAEVMRSCAVCVLPSMYEGLPLVLVEARACGCKLVATALAGVALELAPVLEDSLQLVELPRLEGVDRPVAADVPAFVDRLEAALEAALFGPAPGGSADGDAATLWPFTWKAVFYRIEKVWKELVSGRRDRAGPRPAP